MKVKITVWLIIFLMLATPFVEAQYFIVEGDSMSPSLSDNDIIEYIENEYVDGDMVVAQLHNGTKIVKRLVGDKLIGDNRNNTTIHHVDDVIILGKAILARDYQPSNNADYKEILCLNYTIFIKNINI